MIHTKSKRNKQNQASSKVNAQRVVDYLKNNPLRQTTMKKMETDLQVTSGALSTAVSILIDLGAMEKERFGSYTLVKLLNDNPKFENDGF